MSSAIALERRASRDEVLTHRDALLSLAGDLGLTGLRLGDDGVVVVSSPAPGYRQVARFIDAATDVVGAYVYVTTDDVPSAESVTAPL